MNWNLQQLLDKHARAIGVNLGATGVNQLLIHLRGQFDTPNSTQFQRAAIEKHEQNRHYNDTLNTLVDSARDALDSYLQSIVDTSARAQFVGNLPKDEYSIVRRIAIHAITNDIILAQHFSATLISAKFFDDDDIHHELWRYVINHKTHLDPKKIIAMISKCAKRRAKPPGDPQYATYWHARWLGVFGDNYVANTLRNQLLNSLGIKSIDHPEFQFYSTGARFVEFHSPHSVDALLTKSIDEIVDLCVMKYDKRVPLDEQPTIEGFVKAIAEVVELRPFEFVTNLRRFNRVDRVYLHAILVGLAKLQASKNSQWASVFDSFLDQMLEYTQDSDYWTKESEYEENLWLGSSERLFSAFARIISTAVTQEHTNLIEPQWSKCLDILSFMLDKVMNDGTRRLKETDNSPIDYVINTPLGHVFEAWLFACQRYSRSKPSDLPDWIEKLNLHLCQQNIEVVTIAALNWHILGNLDQNLLKDFWKLNLLPDTLENNHILRGTIAGYLGSHYIDDVAHQSIVKSELLANILDYELGRERRGFSTILEHVCAVLVGEKGDLQHSKSGINSVLNREIPQEYSYLVHFMHRGFKHESTEKNQNFKYWAKKLWPQIIAIADDRGEENRKLASDLCTWIDLEEGKIEFGEYLTTVAKYAAYDYKTNNLLEGMARLCDYPANQKTIVELWLSLLNGPHHYLYPPESIQQLFRQLAKNSELKDIVQKKIVGQYIERGMTNVSSWWENALELAKHQKNSETRTA